MSVGSLFSFQGWLEEPQWDPSDTEKVMCQLQHEVHRSLTWPILSYHLAQWLTHVHNEFLWGFFGGKKELSFVTLMFITLIVFKLSYIIN